MAPPDFGRSFNPILTRMGRLYPQITTGTPEFSNLPTALYLHVAARGQKISYKSYRFLSLIFAVH